MTKHIALHILLTDALGRTLAHPVRNRGIIVAEQGEMVTPQVIDRLSQMGVESVMIEPLTSKDFRLTPFPGNPIQKRQYRFHAALVVGEATRDLGAFSVLADATKGKYRWHAPCDAVEQGWARNVERWHADVAARLAEWKGGRILRRA